MQRVGRMLSRASRASRAATLDANFVYRGPVLDANALTGNVQSWSNDPSSADRVGRWLVGKQPTAFASWATFTRASIANTMFANGAYNSIGANLPRMGYNGTTPAGYLAEGPATNLFLNSATGVTQGVTTTAQNYTVSMFGTGSITLSGTATGTLTGTGVANRVSLTVTATAGTLTCTVSGTCTFVQVEAGSRASGYITTTGSTATRSGDNLVISGAAFRKILPNPQSGCIVMDCNLDTLLAGVFPMLFMLSDGTANNFIETLVESTNRIGQAVVVGGVTSFHPTALNQITAGTPFRVASRWQPGMMSTAKDGTSILSSSGALPTAAISQVQFGNSVTNNYLNGRITLIRVYNYYPDDQTFLNLSTGVGT